MSRLSRDKKRAQHPTPQPAVGAAPIEVHVPGDAAPGTGSAWVGGVQVTAAPGQEVQQAVLDHLHHLALTTGHPVLATIHDERIGYVVPLHIAPDGSSDFTTEPVRMAPPAGAVAGAGVLDGGLGGPGAPGARGVPGAPDAPDVQDAADAPGELRVPGAPGLPGAPGVSEAPWAAQTPTGAQDVREAREARDVPGAEGVRGLPEGSASFAGRGADVRPQWAHYDVEPMSEAEAPRDAATAQGAAPAQGGEPLRDEVPTFRMRVVGDEAPVANEPPVGSEAAPTFALRALSDAPQAPAPGTVVPPTGEFGPPPVMDTPPASPDPLPSPGPMSPPGPMPTPPPISFPDPAPLPTTDSTPTPTSTPTTRRPESTRTPVPLPTPLPDDLDAAPKAPTPPRGFDAVAEAVLGDELLTSPGDSSVPALLAEPMGRISEAVKAGRTDAAAELAERTVAEASEALGPEHPEVLRLRELAAYIAYLAGDPAHAFRVSLDLAHIHHRTREAESAYGNIQSAATAWRAVRDPRQGLDLGHALIELWDELAAEDGPAADDRERLEAAHARMDRLTERARTDS
ncbi:tetratricopeptide repeat protein [Streptomyces sp. YU58]|uniref:tetratricopeptide repeat protein n=1 Tax=Streptomyces sp. SX92 TaxID=3158972 RepID=UPI0027B96DB7|nr:tetratricopeptide repeat protein [Streptomyces coralus]WLW52961.1 tetratricopeptide repeat protein [Streptomyces coralus]